MEEYFKYLDKLRESGVVNMFGAAAYLQRDWGLSRSDAQSVLLAWMKNFGKREDTSHVQTESN